MSHTPETTLHPTHTIMPSELTSVSASVGSSFSFSAKIKQEESDIEPSTPLVIVSRLTPIPISTPTLIITPTPAPTPIVARPSIPTFTPVATTASVSTPTVSGSSNRKQGRQGRPPKERLLTKKQPAETVNYPCHEQAQLSEFHRQKLQELNVYPTDGIASYTRSIPFKGAKESFLKRTGRNRFDVFEYRFTAPNIKGEDKHWWVMWDYYNGLVRVHDFFDCCKPGKTEPGNAVKEKINPGLQNVCHNITGGNLHAQGYWIPFLAAKALAAKFCFRIRYALTIIFGDDFPAQCLPETHPDFGKYQISPAIVSSCQDISDQQHAVEAQRMTPAPQLTSTPLNFSPGASSVATSSSKSPLVKQVDRLERSKYQRISVTPERTAANRYFDPVRGGYTNGSSSSRSQSSQPSRHSTGQVRAMTKKVAKIHKSPRGFSGGATDNSSTDNSKSTPQSSAEFIRLPPMGNFSLASSNSIRKPPQASAAGIRQPAGWKMGMQPGTVSRYPTQVGDSTPVAADISTERPHIAARGPPLPPAANSGGHKSGTGKRSTPRRATSSSLEPQPPARGAFAGPGPGPHDEPTRKKQKITPPGPRMYTNSYMNPITFCVGTFTNPSRASRDSSIPEPSNPYTRRRYDELVASQIDESPDDLLAVEAAGQLMELQRRDYDKDFAQRTKEANSALKRRRSN